LDKYNRCSYENHITVSKTRQSTSVAAREENLFRVAWGYSDVEGPRDFQLEIFRRGTIRKVRFRRHHRSGACDPRLKAGKKKKKYLCFPTIVRGPLIKILTKTGKRCCNAATKQEPAADVGMGFQENKKNQQLQRDKMITGTKNIKQEHTENDITSPKRRERKPTAPLQTQKTCRVHEKSPIGAQNNRWNIESLANRGWSMVKML